MCQKHRGRFVVLAVHFAARTAAAAAAAAAVSLHDTLGYASEVADMEVDTDGTTPTGSGFYSSFGYLLPPAPPPPPFFSKKQTTKQVFALFAPYGLLVLIPVNLHDKISSADSQQHESNINTFNRLSMSNIQHYDSRMWLHALGMYLLSALAMYFLVVEYR